MSVQTLSEVKKDVKEGKLNFLNLMVLVLSIYVLISILIDTFFHLPDEISRVLQLIDNGICVFFLGDFCLRFYKAENKLQFMKWGWIDLISSIPNLDILRAGRTLAIIRVLRVLRAFRSSKHIVNHIYKNRTQGAFTTLCIFAIILIISSSIGILQFEMDDPRANIKTAEDAIWWSYVTMTTVGYGDLYPVTTGGRLIAGVLMTAGMALFGCFTGFISSWFLAGKKS